MRPVIAALLTTTALAAVPAAAPAITPIVIVRPCGSVDRTNQFGRADPHGAFGIFNIVSAGVRCPGAKAVADGWYQRERKLSDPRPRTVVSGYTCTIGTATAAQQVRVSCAEGRTRIRFHWDIANG
jgi:hypothetical protein